MLYDLNKEESSPNLIIDAMVINAAVIVMLTIYNSIQTKNKRGN